jgi:hypothetical protein
MLRETEMAGLLIDPAKRDGVLGQAGGDYVAPAPKADMHESLKGGWWLAEILLKRHYNWEKRKWEHRMNLGRRRTIPPASLIHEAAYQRGDEYRKFLPPDGIPTA